MVPSCRASCWIPLLVSCNSRNTTRDAVQSQLERSQASNDGCRMLPPRASHHDSGAEGFAGPACRCFGPSNGGPIVTVSCFQPVTGQRSEKVIENEIKENKRKKEEKREKETTGRILTRTLQCTTLVFSFLFGTFYFPYSSYENMKQAPNRPFPLTSSDRGEVSRYLSLASPEKNKWG